MRVAIIASGPSLTPEDCEKVRAAGLFTVAVNTSYKAAPWANVFYAADGVWWEHNAPEGDAEKWTNSKTAAKKFGISRFNCQSGYNSGAQAILFAIARGATEIILLGFDGSVENGTHWHGNHVKTQNPDASSCKAWAEHFRQLPKTIPIINCSRYSAIEAFKRADLDETL